MILRRRLRIGVLILALVNMVPVAVPGLVGEDAWGLLTIAFAAAVVSIFLYTPSGQGRLPRWVIHILVLGTVAGLVYEMVVPHAAHTVYLLDLAHFLMMLCCCKFFELCSHRDVGLVLLVSFLLLVIAAFVSASILFAVVVAVDLTFGIGLLTAFQAQCDVQSILARRRDALPDPPARGNFTHPDIDAGRPHRHVRTTAACSLGLITLGTIVFVTVPRGWASGIFGGFQRMVAHSVTGYADEIRLDDNAIFEDSTPVMRAHFFRNGQLITDEGFQAYMRGQTFYRYHGGRWQRTPDGSPGVFEAGTLEAERPLLAADILKLIPADRIIQQQIYLEGAKNTTLFSMYPPLLFGSSDISGVRQDRRDFAIQALEPFEDSVYYTVHAAPDFTPEAVRALDGVSRRPRDGPVRVPPRVAALARDLVTPFGDPRDPQRHGAIAQGIRDYLQSGEFEYTLGRGAHVEGGDPIEDFLFTNKRGHCEYFASAMTLLCQAVGMRARLVSGYYAGEFNSVGGFHQFRQSDAHAWVEVYLPGEGWVTFDPSPPSAARDRRDQAGLLDQAQRLIDFLEYKWATFVISFDADTRTGLIDRFTRWLGNLQAGFQTGTGKPVSLSDAVLAFFWGPEFLHLWQRVCYWVFLVLCIAFVVLTLRVFWILSLMLRELLSTGRRGARIARRPEAKFYDRVLLLLANKGHVKPGQLTPREFAIELARSHADFEDLPEFTDWFYQAQYGRRALGKHRWERLKLFLQHLREDTTFGAR